MDAWYCASLTNLNDALDVQLDTHKATRRARTESLVALFKLPVLTADRRQAHLDMRSASDPRTDWAAATVVGCGVRDRDRLHAQYRASLAVGGEENDWMGWYRLRIQGWPNREVAAAAEAERGTPEFRAEMEAPIPDYWR